MRTRLSRRDQQQHKAKDVLSAMETAQYLGVSYRTFKEILSSGELPFRKIGRRILISKESITDWLAFRPATPAKRTASDPPSTKSASSSKD